MATNINRDVAISDIPPLSPRLISALRKRAGRNPPPPGFFGMKRRNALGDVDSPSKSLSSILEGISSILDAGEISLYGKYSPVDWSLTTDLVDSGISSDLFTILEDSSLFDGEVGSTSPRLRLQDRVGFLDSFYGRGSWPGLATGPTAFFYRTPASFTQDIGAIKFTYDPITLEVNVIELLGNDNTTSISPEEILKNKEKIVLNLSFYINPLTQEKVDLRGAEISLVLQPGGVWELFSATDAVSLQNLGNTSEFIFKLTQPYSFFNPPEWFTESPNFPVNSDNLNPETSFAILKNERGVFVPESQKEYWYTGSYVVERWNLDERNRAGSLETSIIQDSNIRFSSPPFILRSESNNWGVRWDGYLYLEKRIGGPEQYILQVQTNTLLKIDLAISRNVSDDPTWENLVDTFIARTSTSRESELHYSDVSFDINNVSPKFLNYVNNELTEWNAYIPITIRMFNGGADKANPTFFIPPQPDFFIKTLGKASTTRESFYGLTTQVELVGEDGSWIINSEANDKIIKILQDSFSSVNIRLIRKEDENGELQLLPSPIPFALTTDGEQIFSSTTGLENKKYVLQISPNISNFGSSQPLWKSRIVSPSPSHISYSDLTDGSFQPIIDKKSLDEKPLWWKITQGGEFNRGIAPSTENNPLEGVINNQFKPILQSDADNTGLYGNGTGTFSSVPNIILGEARFNPSEPLGSNYIGTRLFPNILGEGGRVRITSLPYNNATFSSSFLLGENDLGGSPNHLTAAIFNSEVVRLFWSDEYGGEKFYLHEDLSLITESDNPEAIGLPSFTISEGAINPEWLAPINVIATELADNSGFTVNKKEFVSSLTLSVEKIEISSGVEVVAFTPNFAPLLNGGGDFDNFNEKYVRYYTAPNLPFQFSRVDTGEGLSLSDGLKLTYDSGKFIPALSEIPRPPADRVTPFGYDNPAIYSNGICYPPYIISDPLLEQIAISDANLLSQPAGNYNVFWGNSDKADLDGHTLKITEKIEFSITASEPQSTVIQPENSIALQANDYTHRLQVNLPLPQSLDPDVFEYVGNGEKVADSYFLFVKQQE
jgi:hypothetical protein